MYIYPIVESFILDVISSSLPIGIATTPSSSFVSIFMFVLIDVSRFVALILSVLLKLKRAQLSIGRVDLVGTTFIVCCRPNYYFSVLIL